ncbi:hypothetical protein M8J76_005670 [Diaphorina citri]|nr:hypothetical protein M8J76_005670 [Diaphorina citri]
MPIMVNKKSEYKVQFCKYDPDIGKRLWLDNRSIRACRKLTNQETHYWKFQICPEEYECTCTSDDPPPSVSRPRQSLLDKHRAQEVATQVPDRNLDQDVVDHAIRARGPSAPPGNSKPSDDVKETKQNKGVQTRSRKTDKAKSTDKEKTKAADKASKVDRTAKVTSKPPPSPKRRRSQSQLPPRTSRRVYPNTGVDRWKLIETQRQTVRWMSEYQEQFSKHRDEFFSRSPVIRSRPTSAPPCTGLWSRT